jgi:hypothetical protein
MAQVDEFDLGMGHDGDSEDSAEEAMLGFIRAAGSNEMSL